MIEHMMVPCPECGDTGYDTQNKYCENELPPACPECQGAKQVPESDVQRIIKHLNELEVQLAEARADIEASNALMTERSKRHDELAKQLSDANALIEQQKRAMKDMDNMLRGFFVYNGL